MSGFDFLKNSTPVTLAPVTSPVGGDVAPIGTFNNVSSWQDDALAGLSSFANTLGGFVLQRDAFNYERDRLDYQRQIADQTLNNERNVSATGDEPAEMPSWVKPAGLAVAGLVLLVVAKKALG